MKNEHKFSRSEKVQFNNLQFVLDMQVDATHFYLSTERTIYIDHQQ